MLTISMRSPSCWLSREISICCLKIAPLVLLSPNAEGTEREWPRDMCKHGNI
jgi:hypothetical protein